MEQNHWNIRKFEMIRNRENTCDFVRVIYGFATVINFVGPIVLFSSIHKYFAIPLEIRTFQKF